MIADHKTRVFSPLAKRKDTGYEVVDNHLPDSHCFADNSQLYASFKPDDLCGQCEANLAMENCINDLRCKTEFLIIGSKQQLQKLNPCHVSVGSVYILYGMAPKYIEDLLNIRKEGNYSLICDLMIV